MHFVDVKQLEYFIGGQLILPRLSFTVRQGDFVCLLGPSGSGKTTMLRLIAGLESAQQGTIALDGHVLTGPHDHVPPNARGVGMVFQQPTLFPNLTVKENIGFGLREMETSARESRIEQLLSMIGMPELADRFPHQLSGGQQHRVALARAMAPPLKLLLLDEPFSHLDPQLRASLSRDTLRLTKAEGVTCMMVTHDASEAMRMGDAILLLDAQGHIRQSGTAHDIYQHPVDAYAALALGDMNLLAGSSDGRTVRCALGEFDTVSNLTGAVQVGVRPTDCRVNGLNNALAAHVVQVVCTGPEDHLQLQLEGGETIQASLPHDHHYSVGDKVGVTVAADKLHVFAVR